MTTRRGFLKGAGAAGIAFCSCGMLDAARAQQPARPRLPVMVNGKRVKTIDVHSHCFFHEAVDLMGPEGARALVPSLVKGDQEQFIVIEERLKTMDAMAIDMEVLSINPFWYRTDRDKAAAIIKVQNEKLAELCASKPDRFAAFASLALQHPDLAKVEQLELAMKKQGLRGAAIGGSVNGTEFSDPKFDPVWAKAEELGAVLFIHPQSTPQLSGPVQGQRLARQHRRQSAGDDDRAATPDLRGHARPFSRAEDHRRPWRRLSRFLRAALRSRLLRVAAELQC